MTFLNGDRPARAFNEWRRGQLKAKHRLQLVDRAHSGRGAVAVRFIHQQHQVGQARQIVEIALADFLAEGADARASPAAHFRRDFGDIENVDRGGEQIAA